MVLILWYSAELETSAPMDTVMPEFRHTLQRERDGLIWLVAESEDL